MAEIAVNLVVDKLIPLLKEEAKLLAGVRGQVSSITGELRLMKAYLRDAEAKAEIADPSDLAKEWVIQMRQVSIRIQDVIDLYLFKVANNNSKRPQRRRAVAGILCKICDLLGTVVPRHKISSQIGEIRESIKELKEKRELYGFNASAPQSSNSQLHYLRLQANFTDDDQLVGIEDTKQRLNGWLLEEGKRTVIAVVGEGGLGKTTAVRNVYNHQKQSRSFDCYAWVTVSRSLRGEHLLKTLLQSFDPKSSNGEMDSSALIGKLRQHIKEGKYLIVLDDVWEIDLWGEVELALPKDNGRIIITTRNKRVAEFCTGSAKVHIHELKPLEPEDALRLFHLKAFQFYPEGCPKGLTALSEEFVKKCEGVPLAIVAIAALLSTKDNDILEWTKVYSNRRSKLPSDPNLRGFYQVLSESYLDLSYHLKSCLLYFGLFPEQYAIARVRLINLWIAEGFVEDRENQSQQDVAEEYLAELIARSLVKVAEVEPDGRVRSCWVHDLMHDFILKKCEELNFCRVKKGEGFQFNEWTRRLSIDTNIEDAALKASALSTEFDRKQYSLVRSLLFINLHEMPATLVESLFSSLKLLVTLDCEGTPLDHLPKAVGNLFHLKYLNLSSTKIKTIPKFIGKLQNLETLNLNGTEVTDFPVEINSLIKLRYIQMGLMKVKRGFGNLSALQTLCIVDASDEGGDIVRELKNLKQMRTLRIAKLLQKDGRSLCSAIESMTHLCSLTIQARDDGILDLESLTDPPLHLERLFLIGRLEKFPNWVPKLKNVISLSLYQSRLTQDPLPLLAHLSELLELVLYRSYEGDELNIQKGWFEKLKSLWVDIPGLTTIRIDEGALPRLQEFNLYADPEVVKVPDHIQKVMMIY